MYPWSHFLFAFLIAQIFVYAGQFNYFIAFIIAFSAILIDLDHWVYYGLKHKNWNLRAAWNVAVVVHEKGERTVIHRLSGFFIISMIAVLFYFINSKIFLILIISYYSHIFLDLVSIKTFQNGETKKIKLGKYIIEIKKSEIFWDLIFIIGIVFFLF